MDRRGTFSRATFSRIKTYHQLTDNARLTRIANKFLYTSGPLFSLSIQGPRKETVGNGYLFCNALETEESHRTKCERDNNGLLDWNILSRFSLSPQNIYFRGWDAAPSVVIFRYSTRMYGFFFGSHFLTSRQLWTKKCVLILHTRQAT